MSVAKIAPVNGFKRIIVCVDGTWNTYLNVQTNEHVDWSNVHKFRSLVRSRHRGVNQIVIYSRGVGTSHYFDRLVGGLAGRGMTEQILDAYMGLASNYNRGDEVYLIGFSRGAAAVRALAGLIAYAGLLKSDKLHDIERVWMYFVSRKTNNDRTSRNYWKEMTNRVRRMPIKALGVWDTVFGGYWDEDNQEVATLHKNELPHLQFDSTFLPAMVENAFHAMALDETRAIFDVIPWSTTSEGKGGGKVVQVWFPGAHANVGGGYPNSRLSDLALDWMIRKMGALGLKFDQRSIPQVVKPSAKGIFFDSTVNWILSRKSDRAAFTGPPSAASSSDIRGEKVHSSALALYNSKIRFVSKTLAGNRSIARPYYLPKPLRRFVDAYRNGDIPGEFVEDSHLYELYLTQLGRKLTDDNVLRIG